MLDEHGAAIAALGAESSARMTEAGTALRDQATEFARVAVTLDNATSTARADLGVLLGDLPQAEELTGRLAALLREAGSGVESNTRGLSGLLTSLETQARSADETSGGAAARLASQLERIEASAAAADRRIAEAATSLGRSIDVAMAAAGDAIEDARRGVNEQANAITAMVEQGSASLDNAGEQAARALGDRLEQLMERLSGAGEALRGQDQSVRRLLDQLDHAISAIEARFAQLGDKGAEHTADLAEAMVALADHAEALTRSLGSSGDRAEIVLARVTQLREQAEASSATICEAIPTALSRIRVHAEQSLQAIMSAGSHSDALRDAAATTMERLGEAESLLARQRAALDSLGDAASTHLAGLAEQTDALQGLLARADTDVRTLADGASGRLVEALEQVRDAAAKASDSAREALSEAIPHAAQNLSQSAAEAMTEALRDIGRDEIAAVTSASEQAVGSARRAAETLSRQLLTIAETSTAIDARIEANRAETEAHDEDGFARRFGLMLEALNSTSIDVTRLLAEELPEAAWAAYLKGDRGIFTRRAVKLLDGTEARAVSDRYRDSPEFADLVNRYIADFEAMLRRTLAFRDGAPIATTLLSSDVGKLYVALAQAIERLRR
jgi:hypothetical protein